MRAAYPKTMCDEAKEVSLFVGGKRSIVLNSYRHSLIHLCRVIEGISFRVSGSRPDRKQ